MCGFCCFSMRFVVLIDLFGTIILPATCGYLGFLIYRLATNSGQFPIISIAMLAGVYGLQALIFILKRQWQHVGWMIIYIIAYPIWSFVLPVYSFWNQDNFTWGNTRIVLGEKGNKQIVAVDDEGFDPRSIPLQRWDDYALANNLPGRRGVTVEKIYDGYEDNYELDDIKSMYSSVKPASTILTGFPARGTYMAPQSPGLPQASPYATSPYATYEQSPLNRQSTMSIGAPREANASPYQDYPQSHRASMPIAPSAENLLGRASPHPRAQSQMGFTSGSRTPAPFESASRPMSQVDFRRAGGSGPDDTMIVEAIQGCLREVDLDTVTKKQVRALVEQRLQTELVGERRTFLDRTIDQELANM
jgi:chitin synthase